MPRSSSSADADLLHLVDGHRDVDHLVGVTDRFGNAVEDLAVVHLERHAYSEFLEDALNDAHQFDFGRQAAAADNVDVALVEFAVTALLWTVGTPYRLYLIALEREDDIVLVLHHVACERDRKVITQPLFADLCGQGARIVHVLGRNVGGAVARIENPEQQLVPLVAVLAQQRGEVLHGGRFERRESVGAEYAFDGIEDICAAHHLDRREVARPFWYRRFLNTHVYMFLFVAGGGAVCREIRKQLPASP